MKTTTISNLQLYANHDLHSSCRVEINLDQLKDNLKAIAERCGEHVRLMAVVKADAYGHGVEQIARTALNAGADCLAVARISEGIQLRNLGIQATILILGVITRSSIPAILDYQLTPSITSLEEANLIQQFAKRANQLCEVHVRIDIGSRSLGVSAEQSLELIQAIHLMTNVQLEGVYTHLPSAYADDLTIANNDIIQFNELLIRVQRMGIFIPVIHAASSPAIITLPHAYYNLVRCGILMYGLPAINNQPHIPVKPIMQIKSEIVAYKHIERGSHFGYANKHVMNKQIRLAVIPMGYGDGSFLFHLQDGEVLIGGKRAPIVGQIYMDHFLVDVNDIQTQLGDEVVIIGEQGNETISAVDVAERASIGSLNSDLICLLNQRIPRHYIEERVE